MTQGKCEDPFHLERFIKAQEGIYDSALSELRTGRKHSHWMWFIFPQINGLARSSTAAYFAIRSTEEAKAYLEHSVLGPRLQECTRTLLGLNQASASDVFGCPDDLKFCSSMTLFDHAASAGNLFEEAILKYCAGKRDLKTLGILHKMKTKLS